MNRKTNLSEIIAISLLYKSSCSNINMISYEKILEYDKVINDNLEYTETKANYAFYDYSSEEELYFIGVDETNKKYAIINPNSDLNKFWEKIIGTISIDILVASQMENALEVIDLMKNADNQILQINYKQKQKTI